MSLGDSVFDPLLDVVASVAEVLADSETGWTLTPVPPGVDRGDGHVEKLGELLGGEQRLKMVHCAIVDDNPFIS